MIVFRKREVIVVPSNALFNIIISNNIVAKAIGVCYRALFNQCSPDDAEGFQACRNAFGACVRASSSFIVCRRGGRGRE